MKYRKAEDVKWKPPLHEEGDIVKKLFGKLS